MKVAKESQLAVKNRKWKRCENKKNGRKIWKEKGKEGSKFLRQGNQFWSICSLETSFACLWNIPSALLKIIFCVSPAIGAPFLTTKWKTLITTPGKRWIKMNKKDYFNIHIVSIHIHERCLLLLFFIKCLLQLYSCVNNTWTQPGLWRSVTSSLKKWSGSYKRPRSSSILLPNKSICLAEWSYQVIHFFTKKSDFEMER